MLIQLPRNVVLFRDGLDRNVYFQTGSYFTNLDSAPHLFAGVEAHAIMAEALAKIDRVMPSLSHLQDLLLPQASYHLVEAELEAQFSKLKASTPPYKH